MKSFFLITALTIGFLNANCQSNGQKMLSVIFKEQKFCRAEPIEDFPFDVHFTVVSANVYFSGANFKGVEYGTITSNSLKTIESMMKRCVPGSIVTFDDVKVLGPDNKVQTIQSASFVLR